MYSDFTDSSIIQTAIFIASILLSGSLILTLMRLIQGPSAIDRVVSLDLLAGVALSSITSFSIKSGQSVFLNVSLAIAIVAFLGTIAFVKYLERKPKS